MLIKWLGFIKPTVKESTYQCYKRHIHNHIIPDLGLITMDKLNRLDTMNFIQRKLSFGRLDGKGGLSSKTVIELLNIIKLSTQFSSTLGLSKPLDLKIRIKKESKSLKILSLSEQRKLVQTISKRSSNIGIAVLLALYCGLRIGEICALKKEDIDLERREIKINKTLYRIQQDLDYPKTKIVIAETKTEKGKRLIPIPKSIISFLEDIMKEESIYLLSYKGKTLEPRILSFQFKSLLKRSGVRAIHFHALRHTFASRCIELGFDYNTLSEILGHSKASTTMNLYVHTNNINKQKYMDRLVKSIILCKSDYVSQWI